MKLVSKEDLEKVWRDWAWESNIQYKATHDYYFYLKTRRQYETG